MLTGGVGYVIGTVFGVLIQGLIQTIIMFQGTLNSWWTKIMIGLLTLVFIGLQSVFNAQSRTRKAAAKKRASAPVASTEAAVAADAARR